MAQSWKPKAGRSVRYRTAANKVKHAVIVSVASPTVVTLRVGRTTFATITRSTSHTTGEGWYH